MKKKPPAEDRPQSAQLEAIRRLVKDDQIDEAERRIELLRQRYPNHKPLYALYWDVLYAAGAILELAVAAWDWVHVSPNSMAAWEALEFSCKEDFPILAIAARHRLAALQGEPLDDAIDVIDTPFGALSLDDSMRLDAARMLLNFDRADEAEALIVHIDHVFARNTFALVAFAHGDVERAESILEECCRAVPNNLFGLEHLLRFRLWLHGIDGLSELGDAIEALPPMRSEDLYSKLFGLALLGRFEAAERAWLEALPEYLSGVNDRAHYLAAFIAWRQGRSDDALARLRAAGAGGECESMLADLLLAVDRKDEPDWVIDTQYNWWPSVLLTQFRALYEHDQKAAFQSLEDTKPHMDYFARMAEMAGFSMRSLVYTRLCQPAMDGDEAARTCLVEMLARPCGPDVERVGFHAWLQERGLLESNSQVLIWKKGEVTESSNLTLNIDTAITSAIDLPDEAAAR